ncbi:MAG: hypothetical protein V7742_05455 [Halioglobus sp.]
MNKIIRFFAVLITASLCISAVQAKGLSLRFLGTNVGMGLQEALDMGGVDLDEDTNLTGDEVSALWANIASCWAVPMVDPAHGITLGTGIDCLYPMSGEPDSAGDGISLQALSLFVFKSGTIVTLGFTSVRPFRDGGIGNKDTEVTHMTGSIPSDKSGVIGGTGAFAQKVGSARVSGAVDLSGFGSGYITFDCLWLIELENALPPGLSKAFGSKSPIR